MERTNMLSTLESKQAFRYLCKKLKDHVSPKALACIDRQARLGTDVESHPFLAFE
jgi:hypothetical protein